MMIKNDNYEDSKSNHIAGFIITLLIIALIVIIKWLLNNIYYINLIDNNLKLD